MSVTIPKSVTSIGIFSFLACTNLTDVYYTGSENDWSNITMDEGNYHLTNATIHYNYDPNKTYIQTIELNKQSLSLKSGKSETLTATISPENATDKNITWTSSDEKVATVDSNGKVTGVAEGTATITATAADGSEAKGSCTVTVTASTSTSNPSGDKGTVDNKNVSVKSIKLDKTTANLNNGKTVLLKATVSPSNATNKAVKWKSSNTKVAKVDKNGKVTAVGKGKAKITCTTKDGSKTASCNIIVKQLVTKIKLNKTKATIKKGKTLTLKATVAPTNANNKKVKWKSSNTKVATVSSRGKVTARKKGTATITCTAADGSGRKVTCKVTVK
jgi:uncharacterized protein YjdB